MFIALTTKKALEFESTIFLTLCLYQDELFPTISQTLIYATMARELSNLSNLSSWLQFAVMSYRANRIDIFVNVYVLDNSAL